MYLFPHNYVTTNRLTHHIDDHLRAPLLQRRDNLHLLKGRWTNILMPTQNFNTHITQAVQLAKRLSSPWIVNTTSPVKPVVLDDDQPPEDDHLEGDPEVHEDEVDSHEPDAEDVLLLEILSMDLADDDDPADANSATYLADGDDPTNANGVNEATAPARIVWKLPVGFMFGDK
jgi:hypothetical protein